jgi:hypothetical protein
MIQPLTLCMLLIILLSSSLSLNIDENRSSVTKQRITTESPPSIDLRGMLYCTSFKATFKVSCHFFSNYSIKQHEE